MQSNLPICRRSGAGHKGRESETLLHEREAALRSNDTYAVTPNWRRVPVIIKSPRSDKRKGMARPLLTYSYRKGGAEVVASDGLKTAGDSNFFTRRTIGLSRSGVDLRDCAFKTSS